MEKRIYRTRVLQKMFDVGRTTIWNWVNAGTLPAPKRMNSRYSYWVIEDIDSLFEKDETDK